MKRILRMPGGRDPVQDPARRLASGVQPARKQDGSEAKRRPAAPAGQDMGRPRR
jgi:hypothetical protein